MTDPTDANSLKRFSVTRDATLIENPDGYLCVYDHAIAAINRVRREERDWVRSEIHRLKRVSGWKVELIESLDEREKADD